MLKYFWGFMCLYMLNLSVDAPNPEVLDISKSLSFNDQESIIEIVVEQILGFENAIVEFDDNDTSHEQRQKKNLALDLFLLSDFNTDMDSNMFQKENQKFDSITHHFDMRHSDINSPPPEV